MIDLAKPKMYPLDDSGDKLVFSQMGMLQNIKLQAWRALQKAHLRGNPFVFVVVS